MGHSLGVAGHYFSKTDISAHRQRYKETALVNLRLDSKTPNQMEVTITQLESENRKLKQQVEKQQDQISRIFTLLDNLSKSRGFSIQPIGEENAITELLRNTEERQIDLTPNQKNLELRKKLLSEEANEQGSKQISKTEEQ